MLDSRSIAKALVASVFRRELSVSQPESAYPVAKCQQAAQIRFNEEAHSISAVKRHRADRAQQLNHNYTDNTDRLVEPSNYTNTSSNRSNEIVAGSYVTSTDSAWPVMPVLTIS